MADKCSESGQGRDLLIISLVIALCSGISLLNVYFLSWVARCEIGQSELPLFSHGYIVFIGIVGGGMIFALARDHRPRYFLVALLGIAFVVVMKAAPYESNLQSVFAYIGVLIEVAIGMAIGVLAVWCVKGKPLRDCE